MRRGAMVKAMAICTPHPYIGIYKVCLTVSRRHSSPYLRPHMSSAHNPSFSLHPFLVLPNHPHGGLVLVSLSLCLSCPFPLILGSPDSCPDPQVRELTPQSLCCCWLWMNTLLLPRTMSWLGYTIPSIPYRWERSRLFREMSASCSASLTEKTCSRRSSALSTMTASARCLTKR